MYSRLLIALICLGLGIAAGYFGPRLLGGAAPVNAARDTSTLERELPRVSSPRIATQSSAESVVTDVPIVVSLTETADISSEFLQSAALYQLAAPMDSRGIRSLLDEAKQALSAGDYKGATYLLVGRYAELDFVAALDYAQTNGGRLKANWLRAIFHARARIDIDDALEKAVQLSRSQQQIAGVAMLRSNEGLTAAQRRSIIDELKIPDQVVATAQHETAEAWASVQAIKNPMKRMQAQQQVLMNWAKSDPWAAFEASEEIDSAQMRTAIQGQLLGLAAADDPQRALDWLNAQPEGQQRDQMTMALVAQISSTDPEQAEALIAALPAEKRAQAEMGLWMQRAASDPEGAADWVASLDNSDEQVMGMGRMMPMQIMSVLAMSSTDAAERFIDALPAERRNELEASYVQMLAHQDPLAAASRLENIADEQQRQSATLNLVSSWAQSDPTAASRWVERQPSDSSPQLFRALGQTWSYQNLTSAREYAEDMRAGSDRDHMLTGILTSGRVKPDEATEMVDLIGDSKLRAEAEKMQELMRQSRSAAMDAASGVMLRSRNTNE